MSDQEPPARGVGNRASWGVYAIAAAIGVFASAAVLSGGVCSYVECRETWFSFNFSAGVLVGGVGITLVVAGLMLYRAGRRGSSRFRWAVLALVGVVVSACGGGGLLTVDFDYRPGLARESKEIEAALGHLPGVQRVSTESRDDVVTVVVLTETATADQTRPVIETYRDRMMAESPFVRWPANIEFRRNDGKSSFLVGRAGFDTAADTLAQWHALSRVFPDDTIKWTYRWSDYRYSYLGLPDRYQRGSRGVGDISLKLLHANDFKTVSDAFRRLIREFPGLGGTEWKIGDWAAGNGALWASGRYPTELELSVWDRLNEDRAPRRTVLIETQTALPPFSARPRIVELLQPPDLDAAKPLSDNHVPIVAELASPSVDYLVTTDPGDIFNLSRYHPNKGVRVEVDACHGLRPPEYCR